MAGLHLHPLAVASKQFETIATMPSRELPAWLGADPNRERGEFVLVLHAQPPDAAVAQAVPAPVQQLLHALIATLPLKQAVALVADATGAPRNALYDAALALRAAATHDEDDGLQDDEPDGDDAAPR